MQLNESVRCRARQGCRAGVANAFELGAEHSAVGIFDQECVLNGHTADVDQAAEHVGRKTSPFFITEEANSEWPGELKFAAFTGSNDGLDHFKPAEHTQISVISAAGTDRVDVRTGHDRRDPDRSPAWWQ